MNTTLPRPGRARHWLLGAVLCTAMGGCAPGRDLSPLPAYQPQSYRLGGGDLVRIITFGEDQLTGEFRVDDQGRIAIPLLGGVQAAGLTTQGLETELTGKLKAGKLLRDPSVSVEVQAYRPIFVLGEVTKPGQYPYQPGMSVLTTVAVAGGFTYRGVQDYAEVIRTTGGTSVDGIAQPGAFVAPGDVVRIFERRF